MSSKNKNKPNTKKAFTDGVYTNVAHGRNSDFDIEVTIQNNKINNVAIKGKNQESQNIGTRAIALLPARIVKAQSADVDAISGATVTSNAIKYAVKDILKKAQK